MWRNYETCVECRSHIALMFDKGAVTAVTCAGSLCKLSCSAQEWWWKRAMTWWVPWMRKCLRHARQSTNGTMRFNAFHHFSILLKSQNCDVTWVLIWEICVMRVWCESLTMTIWFMFVLFIAGVSRVFCVSMFTSLVCISCMCHMVESNHWVISFQSAGLTAIWW